MPAFFYSILSARVLDGCRLAVGQFQQFPHGLDLQKPVDSREYDKTGRRDDGGSLPVLKERVLRLVAV